MAKKAKPVIQCMDLKLKRALVEALVKMEANDTSFDKSDYLKSLKAMPDCDGEDPIEFAESSKGGTRKKSNRPPSAYQEHTGECMREGRTMQECAVEWRAIKAAGGA